MGGRSNARRTAGRGAAAAALAMGTAVALAVPAHAHVVVVDGDTLSGIAARYGVTASQLAAANAIDDADVVVAGAELVIPSDGAPAGVRATTSGGGATGGTHVVQPGETLSGIATRYGVSAASLAAANGITDPDRVISGSRLAIGGAGGAAPASSAPTSPSVPSTRAGAGDLIRAAAQRHGWDPAVPLGLAMQESGWNNAVTSPIGARGIMQVLPATADWVGRYLLDRPIDLADPADNVAAGMAYLDYLYGRFDRDVELALAAYYEGPGRVSADGPSAGAERYVANVLALAERYGR